MRHPFYFRAAPEAQLSQDDSGAFVETHIKANAYLRRNAMDTASITTMVAEVLEIDPKHLTMVTQEEFDANISDEELPESQVIETFRGYDLSAYPLPAFAVYRNTSDFPDKIVARLWDCWNATPLCVVRDTLEETRELIPQHMVQIDRSPNDDPTIVEIWI